MSTGKEKFWVIIPAAGSGTRFSGTSPKQYSIIGNKTIIEHTAAAFTALDIFEKVIICLPKDDHIAAQLAGLQHQKVLLTEGGPQRAASVLNGLLAIADQAAGSDWVLVHDAARPCISPDEVLQFVQALEHHPVGGVLAVPATDTLKHVENGNVLGTIDRTQTWHALTPQMFRYTQLKHALTHALTHHLPITDESSAMEAQGLAPLVVEGKRTNIKITHPEDLMSATLNLDLHTPNMNINSLRIGTGYDVHRFGPGSHIYLCGIPVPHTNGVIAHSDGDVAIHALCDAILGSLALGDIGQHFPDSDTSYKGISSEKLLLQVIGLTRAQGWDIVNADISIVCEAPRISPYRATMQENLARILCCDRDKISIKATTTEKMGFEGRSEGLAAQAVVLMMKSSPIAAQ